MNLSNFNKIESTTFYHYFRCCIKFCLIFHSEILWKWPLFGSSFFAVKRVPEGKEKGGDHILALNRHGVHFIDLITHVSN